MGTWTLRGGLSFGLLGAFGFGGYRVVKPFTLTPNQTKSTKILGIEPRVFRVLGLLGFRVLGLSPGD